MSASSATRRLMKFNARFLLYRQTKAAAAAAVSHITSLPAKLPHVGNKVLFSSCPQPLRSEEKVTVHFINRDGGKLIASGAVGDSLLDVVVNQNLDIDGFGACEGTLACSTCHVILDQEVYDTLGCMVDEEMDMLDLAFGLTDTSRLGCQVCLSRSLEGMTVRVPEGFSDMRSGDDTSASTS